jgi:hypothetical protein
MTLIRVRAYRTLKLFRPEQAAAFPTGGAPPHLVFRRRVDDPPEIWQARPKSAGSF